MRAVIYARYSSELQRDASIEDQVRLCKDRIRRERWKLTATYTDHAVSGASRLRPGYQKLLEDARANEFDVVVAEALDRLSRDQEDTAALYKQLSYSGVRLLTLAEGEINELHVGLKGTMNALYLKDLALKTRRGLEGRVRQGRSGGGVCYGYEVVADLHDRGKRTINEDQAAIVRRVFRGYAAGLSPRALAKTLNGEGVSGPRGTPWNASTIYGNWRRGTGVLNNELYIGRLIWNRQQFIKDPTTGRRQARPNKPASWIVESVPDLRIIDQALWEAVKTRQGHERRVMAAAEGNALNGTHRQRYLFSGLLICGVCGGGYTLRNLDRYGCANHINRGTCSNTRTIPRQVIEGRVLDGLRDRLLAPELVKTFIEEFIAEVNRLNAEAEGQWAASRRELAATERKIEAILRAIEDGVYTPATKDRLLELEHRRGELKRSQPPRPVARLHPRLAEVYRDKVARLEAELNQPETRPEAAEALRALIEKIVLYPGDKRGEMKAELYGEIAEIMALADSQNKNRTPGSGVRFSMVAGTRTHLYRTILVWFARRVFG
jgi:DNA invertase Pin-like site-specific DNA recombinase